MLNSLICTPLTSLDNFPRQQADYLTTNINNYIDDFFLLRRLSFNLTLFILLHIIVTSPRPTPCPRTRLAKQNPQSLLGRQGVRPANV